MKSELEEKEEIVDERGLDGDVAGVLGGVEGAIVVGGTGGGLVGVGGWSCSVKLRMPLGHFGYAMK